MEKIVLATALVLLSSSVFAAEADISAETHTQDKTTISNHTIPVKSDHHVIINNSTYDNKHFLIHFEFCGVGFKCISRHIDVDLTPSQRYDSGIVTLNQNVGYPFAGKYSIVSHTTVIDSSTTFTKRVESKSTITVK